MTTEEFELRRAELRAAIRRARLLANRIYFERRLKDLEAEQKQIRKEAA